MFDASVNRWSQTWAFSGGGFGAFVQLEGGLVNGTMHIEGTRVTPAGVEIFNTINWTPLSGGRVRQFGELRTGSGPLQQTFDLDYRPVANVTPRAEVLRTVCTTRPQNRELDFALGTWSIRRSENGASVGTTRYSTDLSGCLVEERLSGPHGYVAWSFNTWHTVTQKWHRTYIDNRGLRLVLAGGKSGNAMVMTGRRFVQGTATDVRVTWTPEGERVTQQWELSHDGGASWQNAGSVLYVKTAGD
jgi:hypothetical protein